MAETVSVIKTYTAKEIQRAHFVSSKPDLLNISRTKPSRVHRHTASDKRLSPVAGKERSPTMGEITAATTTKHTIIQSNKLMKGEVINKSKWVGMVRMLIQAKGSS